MNRAEKRRKEREEAKQKKTIKNLDAAQRDLVSKMGQDLANNYIEKFLNGLDRVVSAAVILEGGNYKVAEKFTVLVGQLMVEDRIKIDKFESEFKNEEDCQMAVNKISEEVEQEVKNLLQESLTKKEAIERLAFKFPKLSKSMLTNAYQKVKEDFKKEQNEEDPKVKVAMEYIFGEGEEVENKETLVVKDAGSKEDKAKIIEVAKNAMCDKGQKSLKQQDKHSTGLKVLEEKVVKTVKVKGENGMYEAQTGKGVALSREDASISFETEEQLDKWIEEFRQVFGIIK